MSLSVSDSRRKYKQGVSAACDDKAWVSDFTGSRYTLPGIVHLGQILFIDECAMSVSILSYRGP